MRKLAVLVVFLLALGGCDANTPLFEVKAVAAGVPSLAPFFAEDSGLGRDARVRSRPAQVSSELYTTNGEADGHAA
ncbi:hypothetical protein ABZZ16_25120, partial [Streptomyces sp. NPDC006386]